MELLPGVPVGALMLVTPLLAACILLYREEGAAGIQALLHRALDYRRIPPRWYLAIFLLMPAITLVSYAFMQATGFPLPPPQVSPLPAFVLFLALVVSGFCEEAGWSGYATDPLQERWGVLLASLLIGAVWAVWHIVPLIQAHRTPDWILWWALGTVGSRVIIVWVYNKTGRSVAAAALYHAMSNLCWQLFPNRGSHYDPRVTTPLIIAVAGFVSLFSDTHSRRRLPAGR